MPNLNAQLTDDLDRFIAKRIEEGRYTDANDVVRSALESLERQEHEDEDKLEVLREAIAEGDASGIARGDVIAQVKRESRLIARRR